LSPQLETWASKRFSLTPPLVQFCFEGQNELLQFEWDFLVSLNKWIPSFKCHTVIAVNEPLKYENTTAAHFVRQLPIARSFVVFLDIYGKSSKTLNFQKKDETNIIPIRTEQASSRRIYYYGSLQICKQQRVFLLVSTRYKDERRE